MNPETLRCRILDYTKREMYQHGADGLTMDDIARGMKMSKRTLYKLFPSKTSLFRVCLSDFANGIRSRIQQKQIRMDSSCMEALFITVDGYLTLLHSLGKKLLMDIAADRDVCWLLLSLCVETASPKSDYTADVRFRYIQFVLDQYFLKAANLSQ